VGKEIENIIYIHLVCGFLLSYLAVCVLWLPDLLGTTLQPLGERTHVSCLRHVVRCQRS